MALSFEAARAMILERVARLPAEESPLVEAVGRVLAEDVVAPWDLPHWDNSAMDGYAVRAAECAPGRSLRLCGMVLAGQSASGVAVEPGCAVRIMTGAPVPAGGDAIVPLEETTSEGENVVLNGPVKPGAHLRVRGEDVAEGALVLAAGTLVRPAEISMLASCGRRTVKVYRRPRVAILSTGDELVEPGETPGPGQIINSNDAALAAAVREAGGEPELLGISGDDRDSLTHKISAGLAVDALVTTAGVSMGDRDHVRDILDALGVERLFWKVDIKPGRPTAFGLKEGRPVFSLPGNPVSSLLTFEVFVRPALRQMQGHVQVLQPTVKAVLETAVSKKPGRVHFLRVVVSSAGEQLVARSAGDQNTGILTTLLRANGLAILPAEGEEFPAGTVVDVQMIDGGITGHV